MENANLVDNFNNSMDLDVFASRTTFWERMDAFQSVEMVLNSLTVSVYAKKTTFELASINAKNALPSPSRTIKELNVFVSMDTFTILLIKNVFPQNVVKMPNQFKLIKELSANAILAHIWKMDGANFTLLVLQTLNGTKINSNAFVKNLANTLLTMSVSLVERMKVGMEINVYV